tara:strand:+ start:8003 stop:9163 length:1161 start_codon:yes stop_codon:yes gene_type:complete
MSSWKSDKPSKKKEKFSSSIVLPKVKQAIKKRRVEIQNTTLENLRKWNAEKSDILQTLPSLTRRRDILSRKDAEDRLAVLKIAVERAEKGEEVKFFDLKIKPFEEKLKGVPTNNKRKRRSLAGGGMIVRRTRNETPKINDEAYTFETLEMELLTEIDMVSTEQLYSINGDLCHRCQIPMKIMCVESIFVCPQCRMTRAYVQSTSSQIAYGEEVEFFSFSYKRSNHFQEWICSFQAKETAIIPENVMFIIMDELFRGGVAVENIGIKMVRSILKQLKLRKYYEHTAQITSRLTGFFPHRITPTQETQIKLMFSAIQSPFEQFCPPDRRNFLSYSYCLFKFCEILGLDYLLPCFTLLKGRDKLLKQDEIFEKICQELDWEFIASSTQN